MTRRKLITERMISEYINNLNTSENTKIIKQRVLKKSCKGQEFNYKALDTRFNKSYGKLRIKTQNNYKIHVNAFIKHLNKYYKEHFNIKIDVDVLRMKKLQEDTKVKVMNEDIFNAIYEHIDHRYRDAIKVASLQGLRVAELKQVTYEQLREQEKITIDNKGKLRTIPVLASTKESIGTYKQGAVLKCTPQNFNRILKTACKRANVEPVSSHYFRHYCAKNLNNNGTKLSTIAKFLGHSSIDITLSYLRDTEEDFEVLAKL